ncbi:etoposide-induced protein 2.4-domain-containing protein [Cunninghamella echinulata]|nr:etoposide-induced protein 2.4-domain-containing protein [Cunninghamella echinulata]
MSFFKSILFLSFKDGFSTAMSLKKQLTLLKNSSRTRQIMVKAMLLNGIFWLGSLYLIEHLFNSPDQHHIHGLSYKVITGYPLYLFCLFVNSRLFDQIAKSTLQLQQSTPFYYSSTNSTNNTSWSSIIYVMSFYGNCALFILFIRQIPYIGLALGFIFNSVIMAYYCFEYKWIELGWTQEHRMSFVEQHWPYFLGFGLPVTFLTYFLSTLHAGAIFALFYPSFIINANIGTTKFNQQPTYFKIPIFLIIRTLNRLILSTIRLINVKLFEKLMDHNQGNNKDALGKFV